MKKYLKTPIQLLNFEVENLEKQTLLNEKYTLNSKVTCSNTLHFVSPQEHWLLIVVQTSFYIYFPNATHFYEKQGLFTYVFEIQPNTLQVQLSHQCIPGLQGELDIFCLLDHSFALFKIPVKPLGMFYSIQNESPLFQNTLTLSHEFYNVASTIKTILDIHSSCFLKSNAWDILISVVLEYFIF